MFNALSKILQVRMKPISALCQLHFKSRAAKTQSVTNLSQHLKIKLQEKKIVAVYQYLRHQINTND